MGGDWIEQELRTANLNDKRLNKRCAEALRSLSKNPQVSIPAACGGHAETMAAYRFFENEKTTLENILQPHRHATKERIASQDVVLCVQDTTELDLTRPEQQVRGTGPIGTSFVRRGVFLHLLEAFTPDGTPLGTLWNKIIVRKDETPEEKAIKRKNRPTMPSRHKASPSNNPLRVAALVFTKVYFRSKIKRPTGANYCNGAEAPDARLAEARGSPTPT